MKHLPPIKLNWLNRAVEVHNYHVQQCKDESGWTMEKTADSLNRSTGSVSQDILIASWCKTHAKQLRRCNSMKDALEFIKGKKREMFKEVEL